MNRIEKLKKLARLSELKARHAVGDFLVARSACDKIYREMAGLQQTPVADTDPVDHLAVERWLLWRAQKLATLTHEAEQAGQAAEKARAVAAMMEGRRDTVFRMLDMAQKERKKDAEKQRETQLARGVFG